MAGVKPGSRLGILGWVGLGIVALALVGALTGQGSLSVTATPSPTSGLAFGLLGQPSSRSTTPGTTVDGSSPTPLLSAHPKPTPEVTPKPTTKPKPAPKPTPTPSPLTVKVTSAPGSVSRNSYASITVRTRAAATCSIAVEYASGPSSASGLGSRKASSSGYITWIWKIGGNTTKGTWPIYISCSSNGQHAKTTSKVTVV